MLRKHMVCVAFAALLLIGAGVPRAASAEAEERLPTESSGAYGFYLSDKLPYVRLSPHRCETVEADGKKQPRRITALYALADLRRFGGKDWNAETDAYAAAYSGSPRGSVRLGARYVMLSPEQAGMDAAIAAKLRAIVDISYPFCTAEKMRSSLADAGVLVRSGETVTAAENLTDGVPAESITESELLSAVQTAIWRVAGESGSLTRIYTQTDAVGRTARTLEPDSYGGKAANYVQTENNIRAVSDGLLRLDGASMKADMPLTGLTAAALRDEKTGEILLRIRPNGTVDADDTLVLTVGTDSYTLLHENGDFPVLLPDADGAWTLRLSDAQTEKPLPIRLTGTQNTRRDVCLYAPKDGDASQYLIGTFGGAVDVDLSDTVSTDALSHRVRLRCVTELYADGPQLPLSDAVFSLYLKDAFHGMTCLFEGLCTDADGLIEVSGLREPKSGERYVFVQTAAPAGYSIPKENSVTADAAAAVRFCNDPVHTASAQLRLTDDDGAGISEVAFSLYRVFGAETVSLGTYSTDAAGCITVTDLPAGSYRFVQQRIPDGYTADTLNHAFLVDADSDAVSVSVQNFAYRSLEGSVRFRSCDPLPSVVVTLLRDGEVCAEQTVSDETAWRYRFPEIPVSGSYTVTLKPIAGYAAETDADGIVIRRRARDILLYQRSKDGVSLRGAVFSLHDAENGTHIRTAASDAAGTVTFSGLSVGRYLLHERRAPADVRGVKENLYLIVTDPNVQAKDDLPLLACVETEEGERMEGMFLLRDRQPFIGRFFRRMLPVIAILFVTVLLAVGIRMRHGKGPLSFVYSGRTKLYLLTKNRPRFIRRTFRKY